MQFQQENILDDYFKSIRIPFFVSILPKLKMREKKP